jgi:hypothetical protein
MRCLRCSMQIASRSKSEQVERVEVVLLVVPLSTSSVNVCMMVEQKIQGGRKIELTLCWQQQQQMFQQQAQQAQEQAQAQAQAQARALAQQQQKQQQQQQQQQAHAQQGALEEPQAKHARQQQGRQQGKQQGKASGKKEKAVQKEKTQEEGGGGNAEQAAASAPTAGSKPAKPGATKLERNKTEAVTVASQPQEKDARGRERKEAKPKKPIEVYVPPKPKSQPETAGSDEAGTIGADKVAGGKSDKSVKPHKGDTSDKRGVDKAMTSKKAKSEMRQENNVPLVSKGTDGSEGGKGGAGIATQASSAQARESKPGSKANSNKSKAGSKGEAADASAQGVENKPASGEGTVAKDRRGKQQVAKSFVNKMLSGDKSKGKAQSSPAACEMVQDAGRDTANTKHAAKAAAGKAAKSAAPPAAAPPRQRGSVREVTGETGAGVGAKASVAA